MTEDLFCLGKAELMTEEEINTFISYGADEPSIVGYMYIAKEKVGINSVRAELKGNGDDLEPLWLKKRTSRGKWCFYPTTAETWRIETHRFPDGHLNTRD